MSAHSAVQAIVLGAAQTLGKEVAEDLSAYLSERFRTQDGAASTLTVTARDVQTFVAGGPFATFVADKVIRDACSRFAALPLQERQTVLLAAATYGRDPASVVRQVVAYMAQRV